MTTKLYRLKHKPTGLYYTPNNFGVLSERGKIYQSANNALTHAGPRRVFELHIMSEKTKEKYLDVLETVGTLRRTTLNGKPYIEWHCTATVDDFEKEYLE